MAVKCILVGQTPSVLDGVTENVQTQLDNKQNNLPSNVLINDSNISLTNISGGDAPGFRLLNDGTPFLSAVYSVAEDSYYGFSAPLSGDNNDQKGFEIYLSSAQSLPDFTTPIALKNVANPTDPTDAMNLRSTEEVAAKKVAVNGILQGDGAGNVTAADMTEVELVDLPPTISKTSVSLAAASWTGTASPYTQTVTVSGGTAASQVDIQANATVIQQMMNDGTNAIYIANNNGTFTAYAVGEKPSADLRVQLTVYDVIQEVIDNILNNNSWGTIRAVSDMGEGENYWNVGDTKSITINGKIGNTTVNQTINAVILGFNHNADKEGNNRIHFLIGKSGDNICGMTDSKYNTEVSEAGWCSMNPSSNTLGTNMTGWSNSYMRQTFLGNTGTPAEPVENTFLAALPADLRAEMKSCTKYSDNTGDGPNPSSAVTPITDYLFLLAEFEVFGTHTHANIGEQYHQVQYPYFKAGNDKIAGSWGDPEAGCLWWLRSVFDGNSTDFCIVEGGGSSDSSSAKYSLGVLAGFCI